MSMVSNGLAWLKQQLTAHAGQAVVYRAGSVEIDIDDAVLGASEYDAEDAAGVTVRVEVVDWLIDPDQLEIDDEPFNPQPGHRIEQTIAGTLRRFEVQNLGRDQGCWRWSGPSRNLYRIHTREIPAT